MMVDVISSEVTRILTSISLLRSLYTKMRAEIPHLPHMPLLPHMPQLPQLSHMPQLPHLPHSCHTCHTCQSRHTYRSSMLIIVVNELDSSTSHYVFLIQDSSWLADHIKIPLLNLIKADKTLTLPFHTWTLYEYPMLPTTTRHVWAVKTSSALEKPRFVILGFQTNRQNKKDQNASHFDLARLRDVKLYLNSQSHVEICNRRDMGPMLDTSARCRVPMSGRR